jgi:hypothetical protein
VARALLRRPRGLFILLGFPRIEQRLLAPVAAPLKLVLPDDDAVPLPGSRFVDGLLHPAHLQHPRVGLSSLPGVRLVTWIILAVIN